MNLPSLETVFTLTWHSSLRACVLIAVVLVMQALAGKRLPARFRYALSLLVLLRLIVLVTPASGWSVFNLTRPVRPTPAAAPVLPSRLSPAAVALPLSNAPLLTAGRPSRWSWGRWAAGLWLCGVAGCVLAVGWRHRKFARWVASLPAPEDPRLLSLVDQCKSEANVRRAVRLAAAPREHSAAVFGFFRPCLLLPEGMMESLERREARLVLLHELLHIRRRDVLVNWISLLTLALHWFNPLAWVAMRRLRADQELACDAAVLSLIEPAERGAYGRTLLKHLPDFPAARLAAGLVPLITCRNNIKRRIIMITEFKRTGGLARAVFAVLLVALGALTFTRAADDPKPAATNPAPPPAAAEALSFRDTPTVSLPAKAGLDYGAEYVKQSALVEQLKALSDANHPRFIQALSVTASDPILNSLLEQKLAQESKLASSATATNEAEARAMHILVQRLEEKIEQRADGILAGMSVQAAALKAAANDGFRRASGSDNIAGKAQEEWAHQRVMAKADYLEYSNILFNLSLLPTNELGAALTTAYAHQLDSELIALADRVQTAKAKMVEVSQEYGMENPNYKTAQQQLQDARKAYQDKINGVMAGIRTRVAEDQGYLQLIEQEERDLKEHVFIDHMERRYR
jgi:beta-lactamase regulating signal transducer with metallopeptidase domain